MTGHRHEQIAVEGCCHGELDSTYAHIARMEAKHGYKVDCLIINGDFQAIRNHQDLQCMAVPVKYRRLGGFHRCGSLIYLFIKLPRFACVYEGTSDFFPQLFNSGIIPERKRHPC